MPITTRLTAAPAAGEQPLAACLAEIAGGFRERPDVLVAAVQDVESAGLDRALGWPAPTMVEALGVTGRAGDIAEAPVAFAGAGGDGSPGKLMLVGLGDQSPAAMRAAGAAVSRRLAPGARALTSVAAGHPTDEAVCAFAEGLLLASYHFSFSAQADVANSRVRQPIAGPAPAGAAEVSFLADDPRKCQAALDRAAAVASAVALARDLTNTPSARKSPAWLADQALEIAASSGLTGRVWDEAELTADGFGGLLAVGAGSARPPRLILLSHTPPGRAEHVVLIGKGITFDSGGLSLKPNDGMKTMKTDMAGGAAVIAAMSALAKLGARVRVTGLVAAAENMPSGSALCPGDVITHFGGRTTEVLNTDAEGRLVLADALSYAAAALNPDAVVDLATLTGAVRVALGTRTGALYATDERLAEALLAAAAASGEPLWRMPMVEEYREGLDSPVADMANVARGKATRAGSIDAALFLREFAGARPWAHLDIAGAARAGSDEGEISKGATGFGTRLLLDWLAPAAWSGSLDGGEQAVTRLDQQRN